MVETPEEMHARVSAGWDGHQRAAMAAMTSWGTFPFVTEGLQVVPLQPAELPEAPRGGEGGRPCRACATTQAEQAGEGGEDAEHVVWRDERWRLKVLEPSGAPLVLILEPHEHHDLPGLPDDLAAELGVLQVHVARAVEGLEHVARCHVMRVGDGGAHLHVFFFARPEGFAQLRGSFLLVWDDLLPPTPAEQVAADAAQVAAALASSYGGTAR